MKNSVKDRGSIDRTVRAIWFRRSITQIMKPALLVKITPCGLNLVYFNGPAQGVRHTIEADPGGVLEEVKDYTPRKMIAALRKLEKKWGGTEKAKALLKEAHGAL